MKACTFFFTMLCTLVSFHSPATADILSVPAGAASTTFESASGAAKVVPLSFPTLGDRLCRLTVFYRDYNNMRSVYAEILLKRIRVGEINRGGATVIARVESVDLQGDGKHIKQMDTTSFTSATVVRGAFYYLRYGMRGTDGTNTETTGILGMQIEHAPNCG